MQLVGLLPQAWPLLGAVVGIGVVMHTTLGIVASLPFFVMSLLLICLFRRPHCELPDEPLGVLSPTRGNITAITVVQDPMLPRRAMQIELTRAFCHPVQLLSPIEGKVREIRKLTTTHGVTGGMQVEFGVWIQTDEKQDVVMVVKAAKFLLKTCLSIHTGVRLGQGQALGAIPILYKITIYISESAQIRQKVGRNVHAGASVLARLNEVKENDERRST